MEKKTKKKNPQDSTMRNVRAVNKRLKCLEDAVEYLLNHTCMTEVEVRDGLLVLRGVK